MRFLRRCLAGRVPTALAFLPLLFTRTVQAADDDLPPRFSVRVWQQSDGLPLNAVTAMAQAPDGHMVIATQDGVATFDGTSFLPIPAAARDLPTTDISAVHFQANGVLWIGSKGGGLLRISNTGSVHRAGGSGLSHGHVSAIGSVGDDVWVATAGGGLNRVRNGETIVFDSRHGLRDDDIRAMSVSQDAVYVGTATAGIFRLRGNRFERVPGAEALGDIDVRALLQARDGTLWIGSRQGIFQLEDGRVRSYGTGDGLNAQFIAALTQDAEGRIWAGTNGNGVFVLNGTSFIPVSTTKPIPGIDIRALFSASDGSVWVGTNEGGVTALHKADLQAITRSEGLPGDIALPIIQDRVGAMWVGTYGAGVMRIHGNQRRVYDTNSGLSSNFVLSLAEDTQGRMWVGTQNGLNRIKGGNVTRFGRNDGLPHESVTALKRTRKGDLLIGTVEGIARLGSAGIEAFAASEAVAGGHVYTIFEDRNNILWIGTGNGVVKQSATGAQSYNRSHGLPSDVVYAIQQDATGIVWVGTASGLSRLKNGRFQTLTTANGLRENTVFRIIAEPDSGFWISGNRGISRVDPATLHEVLDGRASRIHVISIGEAEGMPSAETNGGIQPAGWRARDGRLWFPTMKGVAIIQPSRHVRPPAAAGPLIRSVIAEDEALMPSAGMVLRPGTERLGFEFTAVEFKDPKSLEFRVRLLGLEADWHNLGPQRSVYYSNLEPSDYTFQVQSRVSGGPWSPARVLPVSIRPFFYQTRLFTAALLLLVMAAIFAAHTLRTRWLHTRAQHFKTLVRMKQKAERRYRALFENANDILLTVDLEGRLTGINTKAAATLRIDPAAASDLYLDDIVLTEYRDAVAEWLELARAGLRVATPAEIRMLAQDGSSIPVETTMHVIVEDAAPMGVQIIGRDISERRRLEDQFRQSQKMEAVGRLAGGIAHDFNNLLTAIKGHVELIMEGVQPHDAIRADLEEIRNSADRAAGLTRQLLAFSRKQLLQPREVELNDEITNMESMLSRLIGEHVRLILDLSAEKTLVKVDPTQMQQVILNLVVNARDAMPDGGPVTIRTQVLQGSECGLCLGEEQPGPVVLLEVADTGTGMDVPTQNRVFEPFFTTKEQGRGTGLGLSTVYGIVEQSGGKIEVSSELGIGTTVRLCLPLCPPSEHAATAQKIPAEADGDRGVETILLVEDDESVRNLTERILQRNGYTVIPSGNGNEALEALRTYAGPVHLVITDVVMPGMSGDALAKALNLLRPDLPVLFMSGYSGDALVNHNRIADAVLLEKPFSPAQLKLEVRRALDRSLVG